MGDLEPASALAERILDECAELAIDSGGVGTERISRSYAAAAKLIEADRAAVREAALHSAERLADARYITVEELEHKLDEAEVQLASAREEAVDGVTLLIGAKTGVLSVFSTRHEAESARDRLNETHEGYGVLPDMDYPYRVETWSIHGADHRDDDSALRLAVKQMRADCLDCLQVGEHTSPESVLYSEFAGRLDAALEGRSWEHDEAVIEQLNATELPPPTAQKEPL